ncbi:MAG: tetratricopeptide repeat protein, partial [Melioribacteraceae bacterium]|nr:tetratricopeptide repeat protein [Melioribacteraceae bacterium]
MNYIKKIIYGSKIQGLVDLGIEQVEEDNYLSAIDFFTHALEINNTCEEALFQRGKCFFQINKLDEAKNDFHLLEKFTCSYNSEIYYLLVKIELLQNNTSTASTYADKYLELNSEDIQAQYFAARTKYLNKEYDESLNLVDLLAIRVDDNFDLLYLRSLILFAQENFVSAIIDIDKALNISPLNEYAFNLRALIHTQIFNNKDSINDFNNAIKLCPTNSIYYFNLAKVQLKIGDLLAAKNSISRAIELDSSNKSYYILKGELELIGENNIEALDCYIKAYQIDTDDLELLRQISTLKMYFGDFKNALFDLDQIREIKAENYDDYYYGAYLDYQLNNQDGSINNLKTAIQDNPENTDAMLQIGILELSKQNYSEALEILALIPNNDNNFKKAILYKIQALIKFGKLNDASVQFQNLNYDDQDDYLILGSQINYLNEKYNLAEEYLVKYNEHNPNNKKSRLLLNLIRANQAKLNQTEEINE